MVGPRDMTRFARPETARTVIVDDDPFSRIALVRLLVDAGLAVDAAVTPGDAAHAVERGAPDVVIVGLEQIDASGVDLVRRIAEAAPASRALVLVASGHDDALEQAMLAGAVGRVLRDGSVEDVIAGVRAAARGRVAIPPDVAVALLSHAEATDVHLSFREQRVLELVADGYRERDVAAELGLELRVVRVLVGGSLRRLQVRWHLQRTRQHSDTPL